MHYHFDIPDDVNNPLTEPGRVYPIFERLRHNLWWPIIDAKHQQALRSVMKEQRQVIPLWAVALTIFILSTGGSLSIANPFPFLALLLPFAAHGLIGERSYRETVRRLEAEGSEEGARWYWEIFYAQELGRPRFSVTVANTRHTFRF